MREDDVRQFEAHREQANLPVNAIPFSEHGGPLLELLRDLADISPQAQPPTRVKPRTDKMILDIKKPGLEIYLTGEKVGWEKNPRLKYAKTPEGYRLNFRKDGIGDEFKHFAVCNEADVARVNDIFTRAGYEGTGDVEDEEEGKRRVWFLLREEDFPRTTEGSFINNL